MRSWFLSFVLVPAIALLLLAAPAAASSIHAGRAATENPHHYGAWASVPRYFKLAWLRDSIADWVFGSNSSCSSSKSSAKATTQWLNAANSPTYAKQTVIRFNVMTTEEETALSAAAQRLFLDIWSFNNYTGTVDILLDKEDVPSLLTLLPKTLHHSFAPLVPDLAAAVRDTYPKTTPASGFASSTANPLADSVSAASGGSTDNIFFRDFQPYPVIVQWMKLLDVMFPFATMVTVGESAEGQEILGLRVGASDHGETSYDEEDADEPNTSKHHKGKNGKNHKKKAKHAVPPPVEGEKKKTILITGGLHAREWISSSSVSYVAWAIINGYGNTNMITKLVDNFDIIFVPVVNPDGYQYTWETDRLWRKTRQTTNFRFCRGFDLDHAFGYEWDSTARDEPCSETYGGESAFQAVEAESLSNWARSEVDNNNVEFIGFLDLHSYSQQIMFPFSYSCAADPPNLENLEELAAGLAKAIRLSTGETYSVSSACEGILGSSFAGDGEKSTRIESGGGSAIDWFYHELKAKYSYQIKLRDTGSYGFLLPSSEIVPTGEEMFSAVKYFGDFLLGNNGIEKSLEADGKETKETKESKEGKEEQAVETPKIHVSDDVEEADQTALLRRRRRR
ncbi:zinc carboxypeptidase [Ophiostoma piceae UAMH 11346]|uniref:Inactive metallocarboxypeptidase ECM14 n=1 Tax=Ophiostoma piceae (strain UAMH 11346) TaxID=1262450 RepID=S3CA09_OPHP1|nr:zinc carboxypeptidase [Ophiostoma piceae UAMH 11346]